MNFRHLRITRGKLGDCMAKKDVNTNNPQMEKEEGKEAGFFKKLIFLFLIPLLFAVAIVLIVAYFTNTNIFQMVDNVSNKLPFTDSEEEIIENSALNDEKVVVLQAEIQQKEAEIEQLQTEISSAASEKEALLAEQERLQFEIEKLQRDQVQSQKEFAEILTAFEKMSAKKAAPILIEMSDTEALRIMSNMKPDTLSEIFTKMTPSDAARYTELLAQE
jgi:flagellar protein FlbB